jgi:hypothetical protein
VGKNREIKETIGGSKLNVSNAPFMTPRRPRKPPTR